ncbi:MAG: DNA repair protein [Eubacteriales bacterium]|nr:DNA repair protein [Eubacteriales bacterium]
MPGLQGIFLCIDMKCFYASVECAERQLNPFETCLVVADETRGKNALCLAISPKMKALGIKNRCRLSEIPKNVRYIIAPPRMQLYIDYAADIYAIYLNYFSPNDIHVYSIDESFIDATSYLRTYSMTPKQLAKTLMDEIADRLQIPSTAGIGTNLYLAKIALDITAKYAKDHMGYLDEELYRQTLWDYEPLSDFWQVSAGSVKRLSRYGIHTMRGIAEAQEQKIYKAFGKNAEILIEHSWGRENCRMEDIKNYRGKTYSVSFSQILPRDYSYEEARIVIQEMVLHGSHELMKRKVIAPKVWLGVGYTYRSEIPVSKGTIRLISATSVNSLLQEAAVPLYDRLADRKTPIRRLAIAFCDVVDEGCEGYDLFTDWEAIEREKVRERAILEIADKYGKNALLRGTSYRTAATQKERNEMIGGHKAGYDDLSRTRETVYTHEFYQENKGRKRII